MRKSIINAISITLVSISAGNTALAQPDRDYIERKGWSLGMTVGLGDLWGDIGTKSPIDHYSNANYGNYARPFGGLYVRYAFRPAFVFRGGINYGTVAAGDDMNVDLAKKSDKYQSDAVQRYQRNLDVRTNIWEGNLMFEISPLRFSPLSRKALMHFQPYLVTGITGYHFVSKGRYIEKDGSAGSKNGQYINLYDLHVEGDGLNGTGVKKYSQFQMAIPIGIGGKWDLSPTIGLGLEYIYRYCFTDYLDGVSGKYLDPKFYSKENGYTENQTKIAKAMSDKSWELQDDKGHAPGEMRGNHKGPDGYSTISITLFYKFKTRAEPWWQ